MIGRVLTATAGLWVALFLGCRAADPLAASRSPANPVSHYESILDHHPERYPVRVQLASALLVEARSRHDVTSLQRARQACLISIDQMPSFEGYLALARIENTSHQFTNALRWAGLAAETSPLGQPSDEIRALMIEAHLGLGQTNEAFALLPGPSDTPSLFGAASRAVWLQHQEILEQAAEAFATTAAMALNLRADDTATWAEINAAGCHLDAGRAQEARPFLESARQRHPHHPVLEIHWAEYDEAQGRLARAYQRYASLADRTGDPYVHVQAWRTAQLLGKSKSARHHFDKAEKGFRAAIEAGEIYTLGPLAELYLDADLHREEAVVLALKNWAFVKDPSARETLSRALYENAVDGTPTTP